MLHRVALAATLSLVALGFQAIPAAAEIDASGTRLSIAGGAPRFYMTYGHFADAELYAPVMQPLRRAGVTFERVEDDYVLYIRGQKTQERWAIVRSRDEVPETGEPCVLELGGQTFVPLKSIIRLAKLPYRWEKGSNQVVINPAGPGRLNPAVTVKVDEKGVVLSGVSVEPKGAALQLRIRTSGAVEPRALRVSSDNSPRLCLDFRGAQWADKLVLPAAMGDLKALRVGYPPSGNVARLAVEVSAGEFNITSLRVERDEVVATISRGIQYRMASVAPDAREEIALRRRRDLLVFAKGRGGEIGGQEGPLDDNILRPIPGGGSVLPELPGGPEFDNSRFNPAANLRGRNIVVDAGHGGRHAGAKGLYNLEKDLCLKMAIELQQALEARGANVIMTRTSDVFVSLDARCQIANRSGADIFISIHCNSMPRRNMQSGSETYWHSSEQSRRLARALHPRLVRAVKGRDGGIRNRSFQVIRETSMPSVLLEIAYINNTLDEQLLADTSFHGRLAENLAQGVLDYFGKEVP